MLLGGERVDAKASTLVVASDALAEADAGVVNVGLEFLGRAAAVLPPRRDVQVTNDRFDSWREAFRVVQGYEAWQSFGAFVTASKPQLGPGIKERIAYAATVTAAQAEAARTTVAAARARMRGLVPPGTVMALPTSPCIAPPVDLPAEAQEAFRVRVQRLSCMSVLSGLPQVTIPAGVLDGCPAGLSFIGWAGGDEALLDLACELARFCGVVRP